ncbi:Opioid growth factor receptor [Collichthys lucidus]|uniref:Opioid growth factor receptor n=1 Tax=Collichthys lucidus TaxID=240159 RepID=A0A4U5USY3_COLLU|nr:Opioid growth factor receptor [Collichthys lucidus]
MEDDCICEYDSTWDTESDGDDPAGESQTRRSCQDKNKSGWTLWHHTSRNMRAAKDMQNYRRGYPAFKKNEDAKKRLVESYELMLGFYGIRLVNKETGEVKRAENWKERFGNLERNMHNNLRITRILKSLGELGFEHYQAPLVRFFLEETLVKKTLSSVKRSVLDYFLFAVLDKEKRQELVRFAYHHFEPKDKFVWCPRKIQKQFRKTEKRSDVVGNGDGKDEVYSRGKSKDGDAVAQPKEDGLDKVTKTQKGTDKTASKDKNKLSEVSPGPKPEAEAVSNGSAEAESNNQILGNGNDSDVDEMDQLHSPNTVIAKTEPCADSEHKSANNSKDTIQEPENIMQTDGDTDTEKPPKKKREDNKVLPSNGSAGDFASGQMEEKAGANKATGQTSPSAQTPHKTSKHSPSLSSGREEKIPRTDFNQVPDKNEEEKTLQANASATNGSLTSTVKGADKQTNGSEDVDMESNPSS